MALIKKTETLQPQITEKKRLATSVSFGVFCLLIPVAMITLDPMYIIGKYNFRLANETVLHEIFSEELECGRFEVYLFNITNAASFLTGEDDKLKLDEVGPFTYIEYRTHENLLIKDGLMSYTPRLRSAFILEESVGRPEDLNVTMPNIPMLSATTLLSKAPSFIKSMFNGIVSYYKSKPLVNKSVQDYLWGYQDPVLSFAHNIAPGLIHFESTGIMDRMYDSKTSYQVVLGATDADKFRIKSVKQFRKISSGGEEMVTESIATFNDTYEGIAYPPKLSPDAPINILRVGICKSFPMTLCGKTVSDYGPDALVYEMSERAYGNRTLCSSKGFCPKGLMDMSPCYFGLPLALSNGHFLDGDPKLFENIEGLKPDRSKHSSHMVIEPKIGLTLETSLSLQVNIFLGNLEYNRQAKKFSDIVLPIAHFKIKQPRLPDIAVRALRFMYITMPKVLLVAEVLLCIIGVLLLSYSVRLMQRNRRKKKKITKPIFNSKIVVPLIIK